MFKHVCSVALALAIGVTLTFAQSNQNLSNGPSGTLQPDNTYSYPVGNKLAQLGNYIGQIPATQEMCKTGILDQAFTNDPAYRSRRQSAEDITQQILTNWANGINQRAAPPIYEIPLVFHVIHKGEAVGSGTNISDAQILSAVDALNRDYRRTAADGGIAQGAGPDTEIQFCLASVDPQGNSHSGINRVNGTSVANYSANGIINSNEVQVKDLSRWDNRYYVNIWVVSEIDDNNADLADPSNWGGGTLGYAYLPTNPVTFNSQRDGIVAVNLCVGNDPNQTNGYRLWPWGGLLNRTLTHEMGHHLNLYHTFEGQSCNENNCNTEGDLVCDTPPTIQSTNCGSPACSGTQQVENYMDYTGEACNNMFSSGQSTRMRAALAGVRNELVSTSNCTPPNNLDAAISSINYPTGTICATTFDPEVVLINYGANTLTSVTINYDVDGGPNQTFSWTGSLTTNNTETVTLPSVTTTVGAHTFNASTSNPNGGTDEDMTNDATSSAFSAINGNTLTLTIVTDQYGSETTWEILDGGSPIASGGPYSDLGGVGTATYVESVCVPDGCYDLVINDSYGDGMCCTYGNGSYTLEDAFANTLASGGTFTNSETTNFCVPVAQGPPTADFVGNPTTILVGGTVDFTDLSNGNPAPTQWNWTFNGGTPNSSTVQNPTGIQYNAVGLYTVELTVDNGQGNDTETKIDYINVVAPGGTGACDTLRNYTLNETLTFYGITNNWGYVPGHNELGWSAYAEPYNTATPTFVQRLAVPIATADFASPASTVDWNVYADANGQPGAILGTATVNINTYTPGFFYYVDFPAPVAVNGDFWVGVELTYNPGDTLTVFTAANRGVGGTTTTMVNDGGTWTDLSGQFGGQLTTSMGIDVLLSDGVTQPNFTQSATNICSGATVDVDATSSTNTTDYLWDFTGGAPATSANATETVTYNTPGTYDIKLYTQGGCFVDSMITQLTVDGPTITIASTDENCGAADGSITVTATGGTTPYQYSIDNGVTFQAGNTFNGLGAGTYDVVVEDANGCTATGTATINSLGGPTINISSTDESCIGNDGTITITATGGQSPYQYSIDNGVTFQASGSFTGLPAGTYDIVVEDGNGCQAVGTATINTTAGPTIGSVNATDASCFGSCDGTITINATGATQYSIDNGVTFQGSNVFTGLCAGTYSIVVEDGNGCQTTSTVTVNEPGAITFSTSITDENCGQSDGSITITILGGGVSPFQYSSDGGTTFQAGNTLTGLAAGSYSIVVEDANGCQATSTEVVGGTGGLTLSTTQTDETCMQGNGTATVTVTGGTSPYTYSWSSGGTNATETGLSAGSHTVTVTDNNGCSAQTSVTIINTGGVNGSVTADQTICAGSSATLTASGGNIYSWDDGGGVFSTNNSVTVSPTTTTTYTVTIEDGNGCQQVHTSTVTVNQIPVTDIIVPAGTDTTVCAGTELTLTASGGSSYFWAHSGETTPSVVVTPVNTTNTYSVIAFNGTCQGPLVSVIVNTEPSPVAMAGSDVSTTYLSQGANVNFNSTGSTGVTYSWDFGDGGNSTQPNPAYSYSAVGVYTVVMTTTLGNCSSTDTLIIEVLADVGIGETELSNAVSIYPNPTNGIVNLNIDLEQSQDIRITVFNAIGEVVTTMENKSVATKTYVFDLSSEAKGFYFFNVQTEQGTITKRVMLAK